MKIRKLVSFSMSLIIALIWLQPTIHAEDHSPRKDDDDGSVMAGTPAILGGTFGGGRYVLFSAHPEFHWNLGGTPLIVDAARWVVQGPLKAGETLDWKFVFPSVTTSPAKP